MQHTIYYDFEDFINVIKHLDSDDILLTARQKLVQLEKGSVRSKKEGAGDLIQKIKYLVSWVRTGKRPSRLADHEFVKLKPVCQSLVAKKQMDSQIIKQFKLN